MTAVMGAALEEVSTEEFVAMVREHDPKMRALVYRMVQNQGQTDDLLQDAYLRAFRSLATFRKNSGFTTWLYRIVTNVCLDHLTSRRQHDSLDQIEDRAHHDDLAAAAAAAVDVRSALSTLPPEDRVAVLLIDVHQLSYEEAAKVLDVPSGTVASRVSRGRRKLRDMLSIEEVQT